MTKDKILKIGLVGAGFISNEMHLPVWSRLHDAEVVAICDGDEVKVRGTAERFKIPRFYLDFAEMLGKESLDLVDICTPPATHKDLLVQALMSGRNCMVEKPLAVKTEDADAVIRLAEEKHLALHVIHNYSFIPCIMKARSLVESGTIGELVGVDVKYLAPMGKRHLDPNHWCHRLPLGILVEPAPHLAMMLLDFLEEVKSVKAIAGKVSEYPYIAADELRVIVEAKNGLGSLTFSFNSPSRRLVLDIIGTKLSLCIDGDSQTIVKYKPIPSTKDVTSRGLRALDEIFQRATAISSTVANVILGRYAPAIHGHRYLMRESLRSIREGTPYPVDVKKCREVVRLLEMISSEIKGQR